MNTKQNQKNFSSEERQSEVQWLLELWENNEDNKIKKDRTITTKSPRMLNEFYQNTLVKLIENYDYSGALTLLDSVNCFSEETKELIEAALKRTQLDTDNAEKNLSKYGFALPVSDDKKRVVEYALSIANNLKKENYADFIRSITPLMTDLYIKALEKFCNIHIKNVTKIKDGVMRWEELKDREDSERKNEKLKILPVLKRVINKDIDNIIVSNLHLREILITELTVNSEERKLVCFMGKVEKSVRNIAAHQMVMFTSDDVRKRTKHTPKEIFAKLKGLMRLLDIPKTIWSSYDDMNKVIIKSIRRIDAEQ